MSRITKKPKKKVAVKSTKKEVLKPKKKVAKKIPTKKSTKKPAKRKIVFKHKRAVGDAIMQTSGIRDFKTLFPDIELNIQSPFKWLFDNNPHINPDLKESDEGVEMYEVGYPAIQHANGSINHFSTLFLKDMIAQADAHKSLGMTVGEFCATFSGGRIGDKSLHEKQEPFKSYRKRFENVTKQAFFCKGEVFLSAKEKNFNMIKEQYGVDKYWVIAPGGKSDCTCKIWDWRKFQDVVDHYEGIIKFVSIGISKHIVEKFDNIIDLTDKLSLREIVPLTYHAEGCISGVSFLMHLAAAVPSKPIKGNERYRKPCVAIYGGREPASFTGYPGHQILHTEGSLNCCDYGGCWHSRTVPLAKKPEGNKRLCTHTVSRDGRTIQECMNVITAEDVIRSVDKYYEGNLRSYSKPIQRKEIVKKKTKKKSITSKKGKEINVLASLRSKGGGEQSACKIVEILREAGWKVNFYPWENVHDKYKKVKKEKHNFKNGSMVKNMKEGLPLLFYANDQIGDFCIQKKTGKLIEKSSGVIVSINYVNDKLPKTLWLSKTKKLKAVIFQNEEKKNDFIRDEIGFEDTQLVSLFGAIDLNSLIEVQPATREGSNELVILKHCTADGRKYTTESSEGKGEKVHVWQQKIHKYQDKRFYGRLLKDTKNTRFEFMEAPKELVEAFKDESRMVFHKFDSMPVIDFLKRGHIYLYRSSNEWRDQYPRCVAEALAVGMPVLSEPRDGTKDRIEYGDTGFYCVDYDAYLACIKLLQRKEGYRLDMGLNAKAWAKNNLDPKRWVNVVEEVLC